MRAVNRVSLRTRLMVSYVAVCGLGIAVLFVTVDLTAPSFFQQRVEHMNAGAGPGGQGGQGQVRRLEEAAELDAAMSRSLRQGLVIAAVVALAAGIVAGVLLARQVGTSAKRLAVASSRIARGEYDQRVVAEGPPEFVELASSFNAMAASLAGVEERRRELIGDVAHELRTPITVISGYVEGLSDGVFPATAETWSKLAEETGRLGRLAEELAELSRAEGGRLELTTVDVVPAAAVAAVTDRLGQQLADKGLLLTVDVPGDLPPVRADFDRLVQVLTNLVVNAIKYTPAPGEVAISGHHSGNSVTFAVHDTGIGIDAEHLPHVFERFYRVDRSRSRASGGTGIGLAIVRALAEAMDGSVSAESPGAGKGATFTVRLPVAGHRP